jgi:Pvc16 N-terminal domain
VADHTAIAGVSRSLRTLLRDRMTSPVTITLAPPDITVSGVNDARVNLYLFQVLENAELKNQEIPGRGHPARYGRPPLSINLRYLITSHSSTESEEESDLNAQVVLGDAMRVLHDHAVLTESLTITRPAAGTVGDPVLDISLRDEFEQTKVTLFPAGLEELSKLWSGMPDVNFRRSVVYEVTVVQIESRAERRLALPVAMRRIFATARSRPEITGAWREPAPGDTIRDIRVRPGEPVVLEGRNMVADRVYVRFGALEPIRIPLAPSGHFVIAVPDDTYPIDLDHPATRPIPVADRLQPGPLLVQIIAEHPVEGVAGALDRGVPVAEPRRFRSNQALLELVPEITGVVPADGTTADLLRVDGRRLYHPDLTSYLVIGDAPIEVREPGPGDPWAAPTDTSVQVPLSSLATALPTPPPAGQSYDVTVQVNGARNRADGATFLLRP